MTTEPSPEAMKAAGELMFSWNWTVNDCAFQDRRQSIAAVLDAFAASRIHPPGGGEVSEDVVERVARA